MSCLTTLVIATVLLPHVGLCAVHTLCSYYDALLYYPILAIKQQIKNALNPSASMADFRFKGYVNDFMVSPRNPITQSMTGKWTQKKTTNSFLNGCLFVVP